MIQHPQTVGPWLRRTVRANLQLFSCGDLEWVSQANGWGPSRSYEGSHEMSLLHYNPLPSSLGGVWSFTRDGLFVPHIWGCGEEKMGCQMVSRRCDFAIYLQPPPLAQMLLISPCFIPSDGEVALSISIYPFLIPALHQSSLLQSPFHSSHYISYSTRVPWLP